MSDTGSESTIDREARLASARKKFEEARKKMKKPTTPNPEQVGASARLPDTATKAKLAENYQLHSTIEEQRATIDKLKEENTDLKLTNMDLKEQIKALEQNIENLKAGKPEETRLLRSKFDDLLDDDLLDDDEDDPNADTTYGQATGTPIRSTSRSEVLRLFSSHLEADQKDFEDFDKKIDAGLLDIVLSIVGRVSTEAPSGVPETANDRALEEVESKPSDEGKPDLDELDLGPIDDTEDLNAEPEATEQEAQDVHENEPRKLAAEPEAEDLNLEDVPLEDEKPITDDVLSKLDDLDLGPIDPAQGEETEKDKVAETQADSADAEKADAENAEQEKAEQEKAEQEKAEQEKAEQEEAEQEKAEQEKAEQEEAERKEAEERAQQEQLEKERAEQERIEEERHREEKAAEEKAEEERLEKERAEKERAEKEAAEKEAAEKKEAERQEAEEKAEQERLEQERIEQEKLEQEQAEQQRIEAEKAEQERIAKEKAEEEKAEAERQEQERLEQEKLEQEKAEQERIEQEEKERAEQKRIEEEKAEQERLAEEKAEQERIEQEKAEQERLEKEKAEQERAEQERAEKERAEQEEAEKELAKEKEAKLDAALSADLEDVEVEPLQPEPEPKASEAPLPTQETSQPDAVDLNLEVQDGVSSHPTGQEASQQQDLNNKFDNIDLGPLHDEEVALNNADSKSTDKPDDSIFDFSAFQGEDVSLSQISDFPNEYATEEQKAIAMFSTETADFKERLMMWKNWQVDMTGWTTLGIPPKVAL
ncbi:hypothetical protein C7M61_004731 [Candidozyma pseudohaemuli]|uniref:Uncharacterized protein n=1 Tax=Candidozyma pseudohaemuli TaxID=418784 RepID=A0A2P7YH35_9ASCO|nr:hypothetical protein C7M61_004731 [[Candida] pseudohaemulonii]PSK35273.1 hypothetical protein C7M61_004731 [[Candida] pseudohaemulonii]